MSLLDKPRKLAHKIQVEEPRLEVADFQGTGSDLVLPLILFPKMLIQNLLQQLNPVGLQVEEVVVLGQVIQEVHPHLFKMKQPRPLLLLKYQLPHCLKGDPHSVHPTGSVPATKLLQPKLQKQLVLPATESGEVPEQVPADHASVEGDHLNLHHQLQMMFLKMTLLLKMKNKYHHLSAAAVPGLVDEVELIVLPLEGTAVQITSFSLNCLLISTNILLFYSGHICSFYILILNILFNGLD